MDSVIEKYFRGGINPAKLYVQSCVANCVGVFAGMRNMLCVKCLSQPTTQARIADTYVSQTVDTVPVYGRSANNKWIIYTGHITL